MENETSSQSCLSCGDDDDEKKPYTRFHLVSSHKKGDYPENTFLDFCCSELGMFWDWKVV